MLHIGCHLSIARGFNHMGHDALDIGAENEAFLNELDKFYLLRYPRRKDGAVEVGSDQLTPLDALLHRLWKAMPKELVETYEKIDRTKKGGRVLMKKRIESV